MDKLSRDEELNKEIKFVPMTYKYLGDGKFIIYQDTEKRNKEPDNVD